MSEPIRVGDIVQVIRPVPCCGAPTKLGWVTQITHLWTANAVQCNQCGTHVIGSFLYIDDTNGWFAAASRVKRIPPLEELDDVKNEQEIEA